MEGIPLNEPASDCDLFRFSRAERRILRQLMLGREKAEDVAKSLNIALPWVRPMPRTSGPRRISRGSGLVTMARAATRLA